MRKANLAQKLSLQIFDRRNALISHTIIALNLLFFALETLAGGNQNIKTLDRLGALVPDEVWSGQWWRLITTNFLHFGWLHLASNMLAVYFICPIVEFSFGKIKFLIAYLLSGIGSMFIFSIISLKMGNEEQILVGASAAIMGMVGAIGAISFKAWRKEKSIIAARRSILVIFIIILQSIFDFLIPKVFDSLIPKISFLSHILGLIIGFCIGIIF